MLTAIVTVIIFLVLISLHEFGHFIMAKACGVKVADCYAKWKELAKTQDTTLLLDNHSCRLPPRAIFS